MLRIFRRAMMAAVVTFAVGMTATQAQKGEPILVSGVVIVPQGPPPPGGRPIVAWAHPTSGRAVR